MYVAILSIICLAITNILVSFSKTYHTVSALSVVDRSGIDVMERMTRDIRGATSVDVATSTFVSSPGVLSLITTSGAVSTTTKFYVQSGVLKVDVNGSYFGPLTLSNTSVTSLIFRLLDNGTTTAVKIDLTLQGTVGTTTKIKNYHSTVVLRGQ